MKKDIHPKYAECTIVCACGNTVHTRSSKENIHVEICSKCHPFYTGKQKLVDSAGMVDRFKKRYGNGKTVAEKPKVSTKETEEATSAPVEESKDAIEAQAPETDPSAGDKA